MATLIDSSVLIAAERGDLAPDVVSIRYAEEDVAISAVTASELLHGVHRARTASQRHRREAFVERLLAQLPVIGFDLTVARVHASLWADLAKRGLLPALVLRELASELAVITRAELRNCQGAIRLFPALSSNAG